MNVPKVNKDAISYCYFVYNGSVEIEKDKPIRFELQSISLLAIESQRFEFSLDHGRAIYCVYHLPKSVPFAEKRPRKPETGVTEGFEEMEHREFSSATSRKSNVGKSFNSYSFTNDRHTFHPVHQEEQPFQVSRAL